MGRGKYCNPRKKGDAEKPAWKVQTLFSMRCGNIFNPKISCKDRSKKKGYELAKFAATGAILHMIQDSYS